MNSTKHPGMYAVSLLNDFLDQHGNDLLHKSSYTVPKHYSLARGNEGVANHLLTTEHAFGGDLHAKLRRIAGMYYRLVDQEALPDDIRALIHQLDDVNARYRENIAELEKMVEEKAKQFPKRDWRYANNGALFIVSERCNRALSKEIQKNIMAIREESEPILEKYEEALKAYPLLPLHIKVGNDSKAPKTTIKATIPNKKHGFYDGNHGFHDDDAENYSLIQTLLAAGMQQHFIASTIKKLPSIPLPTAEERLLQSIENMFERHIEQEPDAKAVLEAFDNELLKVVKQNTSDLQKKYGAALAKSSPEIYADFIRLQKQIGLDLPDLPPLAETEKTETPVSQIGVPVPPQKTRPHPCPHLAAQGYTITY